MYNMGYAPIVMFVYNRPKHFLEAIEALARCPESEESEIFVYSDGPKTEKDAIKVSQVRKYVRMEMAKRRFANVRLIERKVNVGMAQNVIDAVNEITNRYGKAIICEDDAVCSPYLLKFLNAALNYYEENESVGSIAGYTPSFEFPEGFNKDTFAAYRPSSYSWAVWKRSWENVDWDLEHMKDYYNNTALVKLLNSNGSDRFDRLCKIADGKSSSWSVRFHADLVRNNLVTVYPRYSYVVNTGIDVTEQRAGIEDQDMNPIDLSLAKEEFEFSDIEIDLEIQRAMKRHYSEGAITEARKFAKTLAKLTTKIKK